MRCLQFFSVLTIGLCFGVASAQIPESNQNIYLKCISLTSPIPVSGLHDVYIDTKAKTFTDPNFGTTTPYREEGPFLIAETYRETQGSRSLSSSLRINRFTLEFVSELPVLKIMDRGKCSISQSRI